MLVDSLGTSSGQVGDKTSTHGLLEETTTAVFPPVLQPSGSSPHPFALLSEPSSVRCAVLYPANFNCKGLGLGANGATP